MPVERGRAFETGAAEPKAMGARRIGSEPFGVHVKDEEDRSVLHIRRDKIVWFPRVDGNNGVFGEQPSLIAHINAGGRSTDMKNQMPFAMRMHVEGSVQLIDRRATEPAVEDGESLAHAFPPAGMFLVFSTSVQHPPRECKGRSHSARARADPGALTGARSQMRRTQYFLHSGTVRL